MTLAVQFTHVSRQFGEVKAVDRVSIDIQDGDFFSMLGPSGSDKTTCLRLIAGFEQPSAGSIRIHGEEAATADGWKVLAMYGEKMADYLTEFEHA